MTEQRVSDEWLVVRIGWLEHIAEAYTEKMISADDACVLADLLRELQSLREADAQRQAERCETCWNWDVMSRDAEGIGWGDCSCTPEMRWPANGYCSQWQDRP